MFISKMTSMQKGDIVTLCIHGKVVAEGSIHSNDPSAICNFIMLEHSRVCVIIEKVRVNDAMVPYPTIGALTLDQAIGSFIMWDKNNVYKKNVDQENLLMSTRKTRDDWVNQKVLLWSFNHTQVVAKGYILLAYPHEAIDNEELKNDHVAVTIPKMYVHQLVHQIDNEIHEDNEVENIDIQLIKWPITQVTFKDGSKLVDQQQEDDITFELHKQDMLSALHIDTTGNAKTMGKRKYRMVNRKPLQNECRSKKSKISQFLMSKSIHAVSIVDCCDNNCCQHVERKKVEEAR